MTIMISQLLRKVSAIGTLALFASIATIPKAVAQSYRTVTLINNNSQQIVAGYIKTPDSNNWSYAFDITDWFESGASKKININASVQCIYDVKMVYISGSFDYGRFNLCQNGIRYSGNGGDYSPSGTYRGAKGCEYSPTWGLSGSRPLGC
jgi:hypothetical protein